MATRSCINHKDAPSVTMCHQCHHPICKACSVVAPQGTYCSPECVILHREMKSRLQEPESQSFSKLTGMIKLVAAFGLITLGFIGINVAAQKVPKLKSIDVIGRVMDALKAR
jgi:hypothetical protein